MLVYKTSLCLRSQKLTRSEHSPRAWQKYSGALDGTHVSWHRGWLSHANPLLGEKEDSKQCGGGNQLSEANEHQRQASVWGGAKFCSYHHSPSHIPLISSKGTKDLLMFTCNDPLITEQIFYQVSFFAECLYWVLIEGDGKSCRINCLTLKIKSWFPSSKNLSFRHVYCSLYFAPARQYSMMMRFFDKPLHAFSKL